MTPFSERQPPTAEIRHFHMARGLGGCHALSGPWAI